MRLFKRAVAVLALAGFLFISAAAQEKLSTPLIPREVLFGNPERADPQISPDGTQLIFCGNTTIGTFCTRRTLAETKTGGSTKPILLPSKPRI